MKRIFLSILICIVIIPVSIYCNISIENGSPILTLNQGKVKGLILNSRGGNEYYAFLGVPYASNTERFEVSKMMGKWEGIKDGTKFGPICAHFDPFIQEFVGEEDCLTINIYISKDSKTDKTTIFNIHGGGFMFWSGEYFKEKYFMDKNIVYVTFNYRLSLLGFFNTGDVVVAGNMGLKDQSLALKFINENTKNLNADPKKITLMGNSAGGASVNYHLLSPMSKGLFNYAISQSGSVLCNWAFMRNPKFTSRTAAKAVDCPSNNTQEMVKCLKQKDFKEVLKANSVFAKWNGEPSVIFGPSIEYSSNSPFLTDSPYKLLKEGKIASKVPWLTGFNEDEGLFLHTAGFFKNPDKITEINENWTKIAPITLAFRGTSQNRRNAEQVSRDIREFYFKNGIIKEDNYKNLTNMYSDRWFIQGIKNAIILMAKNGVTVYPYLFGYKGPFSITLMFGFEDYFGVSHVDESLYLHNIILGDEDKYPRLAIPEFEKGSAAFEMSENLIDLWTSFADKGVPNPNWGSISELRPVSELEYNKKESLKYFHISSNGETENIDDNFDERINFWNKLPLKELDSEDNYKTI